MEYDFDTELYRDIVTYAHEANPTGPRFRQYACDRLPPWAVDVRQEPLDTPTNIA